MRVRDETVMPLTIHERTTRLSGVRVSDSPSHERAGSTLPAHRNQDNHTEYNVYSP